MSKLQLKKKAPKKSSEPEIASMNFGSLNNTMTVPLCELLTGL